MFVESDLQCLCTITRQKQAALDLLQAQNNCLQPRLKDPKPVRFSSFLLSWLTPPSLSLVSGFFDSATPLGKRLGLGARPLRTIKSCAPQNRLELQQTCFVAFPENLGQIPIVRFGRGRKKGKEEKGERGRAKKEERERAKKRFQASGFSPPSKAIEFFFSGS